MNSIAHLDQKFFDDAGAEHITMSSDPDDEDIAQETHGKTRQRFCQSSQTHNEARSFGIIDERFIDVSIKQPRSNRQYQFNLAFLDPTPHRFSGVAWRWLNASLILAGISIAGFGVSSLLETPLLEQPWLPVNLLLVVATILAFLMFLHRTSFTLTFRSRHGKAPLVELAARNPDRQTVDRFVLDLQQRIEAAHRQQSQNKRQFLRDELRMHYRLWEEGVLPDDIYEAGKVRILAAHG